MATAKKTFVIKQANNEVVELEGTKALPATDGSNRVNFFDGDDCVGSFINLAGWHIKPSA